MGAEGPCRKWPQAWIWWGAAAAQRNSEVVGVATSPRTPWQGLKKLRRKGKFSLERNCHNSIGK